MSLFQSNLRKQIRNLPKILNFVKKIHYYSELFTSLLNVADAALGRVEQRDDGLGHALLRVEVRAERVRDGAPEADAGVVAEAVERRIRPVLLGDGLHGRRDGAVVLDVEP